MFTTSKEALTIKEIEEYVTKHKESSKRYQLLQDYYNGKHKILKTEKKGKAPNNKVVNPYPKYITDTLTGYFIGQPVVYSAADKKSNEDDLLLKILMDVFQKNNEQEENMELAKTCSIKGLTYEILWLDENSNVRFKELQPDEVFFILDDTLEERVKYAVRYYVTKEDKKEIQTIVVYGRENITVYSNETGEMKINEEESGPHNFKDVPVVLFENNKEQIGDFESIISLIDAYDLAQSNTLNDMEQFTDAYLVLVNMLGTNENDVNKLRDDKVLLLNSDGKAEWLIKDVNDAWVENYKNRIRQDIHKFSNTPDMTDEHFGGNLSGVSLRYKLLGMEQHRANKERKFKKGLRKRIELICGVLSITNPDLQYTGIDMQFNNILPQNILEISQIIDTLSAYLSRETLLELLPFVENAAEELEKKKIEDKESLGDDYELLGREEHKTTEGRPDESGHASSSDKKRL